jgi:hypothetical protein
MHILMHELIHAVGPGNDEHSADDVFAARSVLVPRGSYLKGRSRAAEDLVHPPDGSAAMPPVRIGAKTVANPKKA